MNTNIGYLALMILFLSILVFFEGRNSKKPQGQYVNGIRFQKNFGFQKNFRFQKNFWIFLAKGKNLTPRQDEISK